MVNLTDEERLKFVRWLDENISSIEGIVDSMKNIDTPKFINDKFREAINSCKFIEALLKSEGSDMTKDIDLRSINVSNMLRN